MGRSMPSMSKVAAYWSRNFTTADVAEGVFGDDFYGSYIGWGEPFCFGCNWLAPVDDTKPPERSWSDAGSWLERAHVVPHSFGGSDDAFNLIPLCHSCHRMMDRAVFSGKVAGYEATIEMVKGIESCQWGIQAYTDLLHREAQGSAQKALEILEELRREFPGSKDLTDVQIDNILEIKYGISRGSDGPESVPR